MPADSFDESSAERRDAASVVIPDDSENPNGLPINSKLTFFAKNLFDERYLTYISNPSAGVRTAGVGDSRQFGLQLSVKY